MKSVVKIDWPFVLCWEEDRNKCQKSCFGVNGNATMKLIKTENVIDLQYNVAILQKIEQK